MSHLRNVLISMKLLIVTHLETKISPLLSGPKQDFFAKTEVNFILSGVDGNHEWGMYL